MRLVFSVLAFFGIFSIVFCGDENQKQVPAVKESDNSPNLRRSGQYKDYGYGKEKGYSYRPRTYGDYSDESGEEYEGGYGEKSKGSGYEYGDGYANSGYGKKRGYEYDNFYGGGGYKKDYKKVYEQGNSEYGKGSSNYGSSPFFYSHHYSYDTHYCSIYGSFSLALPTYLKKSSKENNYDEGYGEKKSYGGSGYGENSGYGEQKPVTRYHTRQYCRFAAAHSQTACKFCCKVVARSSNTSPDDIVAAIFAFDPKHPSANGAGVYGHSTGYGEGYGASSDSYSEKAYDYSGSSRYQCVCCAPKNKY